MIVRYPERQLTVVVLTNRNDPEPYRLALKIASITLYASGLIPDSCGSIWLQPDGCAVTSSLSS